jgi:predicted N-formylglutamate amidohydrolase
MDHAALLEPGEPAPVMHVRPRGRSPFLILCDHAGLRIPRRLGSLGLPAHDIRRHIGWDIGDWPVSLRLAEACDAVLIGQPYSRLVIDCNRAPGVPSSIVEISESTEVPGNAGLSQAERDAREAALFRPYHDAIARELDRRAAAGQPTIIIAVHSFTPVYRGVARPWHVGVLFNRDERLARALLNMLYLEGDLVVGENEPYSISDLTDYTVPVHGEARGLPHVELEIRQDLITAEAGQHDWADRLARLLPPALERMAA